MTEQGDWADLMSSDLEHTSAQDLRDAVKVRLPQPGERHNASGIPVSDLALAVLLAGTRVAEVLNPCQEPECERCNDLHLIWWDYCNALSRSARIALQAQLVADGYGLPDAPWEDLGQGGHEGGVGEQSVEE